MKNKVILVLCLVVAACQGYGQEQADLWRTIVKVEDNHYIINIPDGWRRVTLAEGSGMDNKYDLTGVGIPASANGSPMYGFFTIARMSGQREAQAMEQVLTDFSGFYDRVTEPGYNYDTTIVTIKSGQTGKMLHTRYYRRSKVSNYSKYYLVIYSPKADDTYVLTLNFQYKDPSYDVERSTNLKQYVTNIFAHFEFR